MSNADEAFGIPVSERQGYIRLQDGRFQEADMGSQLWPMQAFDPQADFAIIERKLPHWSQAGTICFLTWRTYDSIPTPVLRRWHADREAWLRNNGIDPRSPEWKRHYFELDTSRRLEYVRTFSERWHRQLDDGHGACVLREPAISQVVADSLLKFDGEHYLLTDFVVMPNHVHLLAAFANEGGMLTQCESWKRFTAREINRQLGNSGQFWQQDGFDHLVRSETQYHAIRRYIALNGEKAHLPATAFRHFSKPPLQK